MMLQRFGLYFERPKTYGLAAHFKARTILYWLSGHPGLRVWIIGNKKWSLLLLKDDGGDPVRNAGEAALAIANEEGDPLMQRAFANWNA